MRRLPALEKYVAQQTGQHYKVYGVKWVWHGYGAITFNERKVIKIREDHKHFWPLIWHEMGHIVSDKDGQQLWRAEYEAQRWALKTLLKQKKLGFYKKSLNWINDWADEDTETPSDPAYVKAREKLIKEFK